MNECFYRKEGEELVTWSHPLNWKGSAGCHTASSEQHSGVITGLTDFWF